MKRILFLATLFFIFSSRSLFAATLEISNIPATIEKDQEIDVNIIVYGAAANTQNYLRAAFYHESAPKSYFGYTYNHENEWYTDTTSSNVDPHKFFQITVDSDKNWSGMLKTKIDPVSNYYKGSGLYKLKIGRYTASGTSVTDWSNIVEVALNAPSPTFTPTSTPTSTPIPTPTKTPTPTKSPTPTKTPTPTKDPSPTKAPASSKALPTSALKSTLTPTKSLGVTISSTQSGSTISRSKDDTVKSSKEILGEATKNEPSIKQESKVQEARVLGMSSQGVKTLIIFFVGTTLISACAILLFRKFMMRN